MIISARGDLIEESGETARKAGFIFHATLRTTIMTRLSASRAEDNGVMQQFIVRTAEYHIFIDTEDVSDGIEETAF